MFYTNFHSQINLISQTFVRAVNTFYHTLIEFIIIMYSDYLLQHLLTDSYNKIIQYLVEFQIFCFQFWQASQTKYKLFSKITAFNATFFHFYVSLMMNFGINDVNLITLKFNSRMKKIIFICMGYLLYFQPFAQINLDSGLVGYYPFNGNAHDESGFGYNGVVNGAVLTTDRFGHSNSAYYFDGLNDFIEVANTNGHFNLQYVTASACIKPYYERINTYGAIVYKNAG